MPDSVKNYVGALVDRICELTIENHLLKGMLRNADTVPVGRQWEHVLEIAMRSPESHSQRQIFAAKRDSILQILDQDDLVEAMLKLPTRGLPN